MHISSILWLKIALLIHLHRCQMFIRAIFISLDGFLISICNMTSSIDYFQLHDIKILANVTYFA